MMQDMNQPRETVFPEAYCWMMHSSGDLEALCTVWPEKT